VSQRNGNLDEFVWPPSLLRIQVGERLSLNQFHREEVRTVRLFDRVDGNDAWMIERGNRLRLAPEPGNALGIAGEAFGKYLQRDLATKLVVARAIHFAHAAGAQGRDNFIRAETGAAR